MSLSVYNMLSEETPYTFPQHRTILNQTGCVGVLEAKADPGTGGFVSTWNDFAPYLHTLSFQSEFTKAMQHLRLDPAYDCMLRDAESLRAFCLSSPLYRLPGGNGFGVRVDSERYAFLVRIAPMDQPAAFSVYAYRKDWLDQHLENARDGIRFLDPAYRELFRIPDGGQILLTGPDGQKRIETCRYIDAYHLETGKQVYHVCEFADRMEKLGLAVKPLGPDPKKERGKENRYAGIGR